MSISKRLCDQTPENKTAIIWHYRIPAFKLKLNLQIIFLSHLFLRPRKMEIKILQLVRQSVKSFTASLRLFPLSSPHWLSLAFRSKYPCTQMMGYQPQYYILSHSQGRKIKEWPYIHRASLLQLCPIMEMYIVSKLWTSQDSCRFIPLW